MLQLPCPWCGPRDEIEFACSGERVARPDPAQADDAQWTAYLYQRGNARGWISEQWVHRYGCGQWFVAVRHTVTNAISATYPVGELDTELPS